MNLSMTRCFAVLALVTFLACGGGGSSTPPPPPPAPTISAINPTHGGPGTSVVVTGTNLAGTSSVSFNGQPAFTFSAVSSTEVDAVVPGNATSGTIRIATSAGSANSSTFTVDAALAPTLSSFSPTSFSAGSVVTINGTHFVGASQVQFNGANAAAFTVVSDTQIQATAPPALTAGTLSVTTPGGTAVSSTSYTVGAPPTLIQVLMNTGFEQASPLIWQKDTGIIQAAPGTSNPGIVPHGGTLFAWLGGYGSVASDWITQDVYIPATAQSATASFYLKIVTAETGSVATDTLVVAALDTSDVALGTLLTKSNVDASAYTLYSVDLLPYKGRIVRLSFKSQEDAQNATSFLLDDVTLAIGVPAASDLKPLITTFTPTSGLAGETAVQITGGNFFGLTGMTIGGASATYALTDGTSLSATVPAAAVNGSAPIRLTNAQGTGASASNFTVAYGVPSMSGLNPTQGPVGTPVVITGTYLGYPGTTVTLNGVGISPIAQTTTQITFTVPAGATSGPVVVTTPGGTTSGSFTVNAASTTLDLHVEKVQLTQSTQTLDNAVPIVAGKDGLIRVFVLANQANSVSPSVSVTLLNNGAAVSGYPKTIPAPAAGVPTALNEGALTSSWNVAVPATDLTTPIGSGYSLQATVDLPNAIPEADETNNTTTVLLTGTTVPTFKTTIFPVALSSGTGNITSANKAQWVARLVKMYPVALVDVAVGLTFTSSRTLSSDGTGWDLLLSDLATKHQTDGASDRYYFGALNVSYASGVSGMGYVPTIPSDPFQYRTAICWDKTGYSDGGNFPEVFAHETGHNMGRQHSPCGGAANPDPNYPYPRALIGKWGYDSVLNQLYSPLTTKDIMSYCTPLWVSDYVYKGILAFRDPLAGGFMKVGPEATAPSKGQPAIRECLIVRGIIHDNGKVDLLPSFRTQAHPSMGASDGEYTLECLDEQGVPVFTSALDLMELGCSAKGHDRHFVMALPLEAAVLDAITGLNVLKTGQVKASLRSASSAVRPAATAPDLRRLDPEKVQLTWDATLHPDVLVRDADSGEVIAILSGGRQILATKARRFDVVSSDGVVGKTHRLEPIE